MPFLSSNKQHQSTEVLMDMFLQVTECPACRLTNNANALKAQCLLGVPLREQSFSDSSQFIWTATVVTQRAILCPSCYQENGKPAYKLYNNSNS